MPVKIQKRNNLYRVVEPSGRLAKTKLGNALDGGGHKSKATATRQAGYINGEKKQ